MYYTECKLKNKKKKRGRPGNEAINITPRPEPEGKGGYCKSQDNSLTRLVLVVIKVVYNINKVDHSKQLPVVYETESTTSAQ